MKIGIIAPGGFDRTGVLRTIPVLNWVVERLAERHEVHVFTLYQEPGPCVFPLLGATIHNIGRSSLPLSALRTAARTVTAVERENALGKFDVLHGLWAAETGLAAVSAGRRLGIPSVVSVLGGEFARLDDIGYGGQRNWIWRARARNVVGRAAVVTTNSRFARRQFARLRPDAEVIYNGVDVNRFTPAAAPPDGPPWRLLHVGSLNRVKDQATLLRAMRLIRQKEPEATLDIIGEDTLGGTVQALAASLGLSVAVAFHGFKPSAAVAERMRESHLLLHSSLHETGPVVLVEAAAMGVPTVGTSVGMIDDLSGDLCSAVPVGDHEALAQAAVALLRDKDHRASLRPRLIGWARENSAGATARGWEAAYNRARQSLSLATPGRPESPVPIESGDRR